MIKKKLRPRWFKSTKRACHSGVQPLIQGEAFGGLRYFYKPLIVFDEFITLRLSVDYQNLERLENLLLVKLQITEHNDVNCIHMPDIQWRDLGVNELNHLKPGEIRKVEWTVPSNKLLPGCYFARLEFD